MSAPPESSAPSSSAAEPASGAPGFALTFSNGQGLLGLAPRALEPLGRLDKLELEIPNLRFPFDLSGGAHRFANRRCRAREVELSARSGELAAFLGARAGTPDGTGGIAASELGFSDLALELDEGLLRLQARVTAFGRSAALTAAAVLRVAARRKLRVSVFDVRVYGHIAVPAPVLMAALLGRIESLPGPSTWPERGDRRDSSRQPRTSVGPVAPGVRAVGPTELELDPLELALVPVLLTRGWRLPARDALVLAPPKVNADGVRLRLVATSDEADDDALFGFSEPSARLGEIAAYEEGRSVLPEAERALAVGDVASALATYRRGVILHPTSSFVTGRLIQLLVASPSTFGEADELASAALARWPDFVPALIAKAVVAAEAGDAAAATSLWRRVAEEARQAASPMDEASALVAASEQMARTGVGDEARALLERARALRPDQGDVLDRLAGNLAVGGRWAELADLLSERAGRTVDPRRRAELAVEEGRVRFEQLGDAEGARAAFQRALSLVPGLARASEGLARVLVATGDHAAAAHSWEAAREGFAAVKDRDGERRALEGLANLLESTGDAPGARAALESVLALAGPHERTSGVDARARLARLLAAGGDAAEAARRLEEALALVERSDDRAAWRVLALELASLLAGPLGDPEGARARLEAVLAADPADEEALERMAALLGPGAIAELEVYFRRALAASLAPERRLRLLRRLRDLARAAGAAGDLVLFGALEDLVGIGAADADEAVAAARELAARAVEAGDAANVARARAAVAWAAQNAGDGALGAELSRAEAQLAEAVGDDDAAVAALRTCLAMDARGALAAGAWRRLVELLARGGDAAGAVEALIASADDERTEQSEEERAALLVAAAEILRDRLGLPSDAIPLLERAASLDPRNAAAFEALEAAARQAGDWARAADVLARRLEGVRSLDRRTLLARLGDVQERLGRDDDAASSYRRALEIDPEFVPALVALARLTLRRGAHDQAADLWRRVLTVSAREGKLAPTGSHRAEAALRLAQWARVAGLLDEAEGHLETGLSGEPSEGAPLDVLLDVLEGIGNRELLVDVLGRRVANTDDPSARRPLLRSLAEVQERIGRSEEAAALYQQLVDGDGRDVDALMRLGELHRREGREDALLPVLERLFAIASPSDAGVAGEPQDAQAAALDREALAVELARLHSPAERDPARAEALVRAVLDENPTSIEALDVLAALLTARGAWDDADAVFARRAALVPAGVAAGELVLQKARARLSGPGGEAVAYKLLRGAELGGLPREGLELRARLAEGEGQIEDALACLRRLRDRAVSERDQPRLRELATKLGSLARRSEVPSSVGVEVLEEMLAVDPGDAVAAEGLADLYGALLEPRMRARALAGLLGRALALTPERRAAIHDLLAHRAIEDGDLVAAEEQHARALELELPAKVRAGHLVGHAAVLVVRKDVEGALVDLEEALSLVPDHAGALALVGDIAYRAQDWAQARKAYEALAVAPGWTEAVSAELLAVRRAELAEMFGDEEEAEAGYRRVAEINPRNAEAREALAQFASFRDDHAAAARWLEEAVALCPPDAVDKLTDLRLRLGESQLRQGNLEAARRHLELVLAEDGDAVRALELAADVYGRLDMPRDAARLYGRLARVYRAPSEAAEALYREGELWRNAVGDGERAADAYLRSSDLDPSFAPTQARLVEHFWDSGEIGTAAEIGAELLRTVDGISQLGEGDVGLLVGLALAASAGDLASARAALSEAPLFPDRAVLRLRQLVRTLRAERVASVLDPLLTLLIEQEGTESGDKLFEAARADAMVDPGAPDALLVLGVLADRRGDRTVARAAFALLAFLDGAGAGFARGRLASIGSEALAREGALRSGAVGHPELEPRLGRVIARLAPALAGLSGAGDPAPERANQLIEAYVREMAARFGVGAVDVVGAEGNAMVVSGTRPPRLLVGDRMVALTRAELAFHVGRACDLLRAGIWALELAVEAPNGFWAGLERALGGSSAAESLSHEEASVAERIAVHVAAHEADLPDAAARAGLLDDVRALRGAGLDLDAQLGAAYHVANRVALLASGNPLVAVQALVGERRGGGTVKTDPMLPVVSLAREELLRPGAPLRELALFLFSPEYRALVE